MDSGLLLLVTAEYVEQASACQLADGPTLPSSVR